MATLNIGSGCGTGTLQFNLINNFSNVDYIQKQAPALFAGDITEIRYSTNFTIPIPAIVKFKVWRQNGANLEFIGQTEQYNIAGDFGCTTLTVNSVIFGVQAGDYMGVWLKKFTAYQADSSFISMAMRSKTGDNITTIAESATSPVSLLLPLGFFSNVSIPDTIPDLPVRAKDPITGQTISFFTDYKYNTGGIQIRKSYRSATGNLHTQKYNDYSRFEIPIVQINSASYNDIQRWKRERITIFFTENHSETNVDSGLSVKVREINITTFLKPYSQDLWSGAIVLETI